MQQETSPVWYENSLIRILIILIVIWLAKRFGKMVIARVIRQAIEHDTEIAKVEAMKREDTLIDIISTSASIVLWTIGVLLVLEEVEINVAPLLAGASIAGVALGFGAQSLVKDIIAGLFIVLENQYRVNDIIEIAGVSGKVSKINLRETVLRDLDGNTHHVPNGLVNVTTNKTMEYSRLNMRIGVGYNSNIDKVEKVINEIGTDLAKDPKWSASITDPPRFIRITSFDDSAVTLMITGKVTAGTQWAIAGEFRRRLKRSFEQNDIEIPFPQRVIHNSTNAKKPKNT